MAKKEPMHMDIHAKLTHTPKYTHKPTLMHGHTHNVTHPPPRSHTNTHTHTHPHTHILVCVSSGDPFIFIA